MLPNTSNGYYKCNTRIKRCQLIQPGSYNMVRECTNLGVIQVANGLSIDLELELDLDYSPGKDLEQTLGEVLISKLLYDGVGGALTCLSYNTLSADKLRLTHRCILNPMYRGPATLEIYRNTTRVPELGMQTLFLKFKINNTDSNAPTPPTQPFPQNCFCTVFSYYSPSQEHPLKAGTRQTFHLQVYSLKHQQYKSLVVWMPDNSNVPFRQIAPGEFVAESVRLVGKGQLGIGDLVKKSDGSTSISFLMTYNVE